ncbi:MAG: histidinol-phosphatase [Sphaerochaetaceae bacterium]|nr:histidinol-phosphatase [Sphaerochaetaceae bacterium]
MTTRSNLHTHCTYCDGNDSMQDMVQAAIDAGLTSIGFSSHYPTQYDFDDVQMDIGKLDAYFEELESLKQQYKSSIAIYKGMELECRVLGEGRPVIDNRCDYTIGSCHYIRNNSQFFCIDYLPSMIDDALISFGSAKKLIEDYYQEYISFAKEVPFDIIGHVDIYAKLNENMHYFDPDAKWYTDMTIDYIDEIAKTGKIFEVNTGAMSKGYRTEPYPARFILQRLHEKKVPVTISSDSHSTKTITFAFDMAEELLRSVGFKTQLQFNGSTFEAVAL